jgi:hypothetical protein
MADAAAEAAHHIGGDRGLGRREQLQRSKRLAEALATQMTAGAQRSVRLHVPSRARFFLWREGWGPGEGRVK